MDKAVIAWRERARELYEQPRDAFVAAGSWAMPTARGVIVRRDATRADVGLGP
jgi:hypothetical protein